MPPTSDIFIREIDTWSSGQKQKKIKEKYCWRTRKSMKGSKTQKIFVNLTDGKLQVVIFIPVLKILKKIKTSELDQINKVW